MSFGEECKRNPPLPDWSCLQEDDQQYTWHSPPLYYSFPPGGSHLFFAGKELWTTVYYPRGLVSLLINRLSEQPGWQVTSRWPLHFSRLKSKPSKDSGNNIPNSAENLQGFSKAGASEAPYPTHGTPFHMRLSTPQPGWAGTFSFLR